LDKKKANRFTDIYSGTSYSTSDPSQLPECDIACITIPVGLRSSYIKELGERGTAIFCEKPFAITPESHKNRIQNADKIICNYQRIHYHMCKQMKQILSNKPFGQLKSVELNEGSAHPGGISPNSYRTDIAKSGGNLLYEEGPHTLSQLLHIMDGHRIEINDAEIKWDGQFEVDVEVEMTARKQSSVVPIRYNLSNIADIGRYTEFRFSECRLRFTQNTPDSPIKLIYDEESSGEIMFKINDENPTSHTQAIYHRWQTFIDHISDTSKQVPIKTGLRVTELIDEIYTIAGDKREVYS
jgi:predicted dehydrogenase